MREINKPAQIIKMLDADDVAVVLEALGALVRATDEDDPKGDRAWEIRQTIKSAMIPGSVIVQIGGEA